MSYYTAPGTPTIRGRLSSEEIRDQWSALELAFALLPLPVSGGNVGFQGGQWVGGSFTSATVTSSVLGSVVAPNDGYFAKLFMVGSTTTSIAPGQRAWISNMAGDWKLLKESAVQLVIDTNGNVVIGDGVNERSTSSSTGLFYLPTVNGIPTGTPTAYPAAVAMVYNRAADKIGVFNVTWKFTAALT